MTFLISEDALDWQQSQRCLNHDTNQTQRNSSPQRNPTLRWHRLLRSDFSFTSSPWHPTIRITRLPSKWKREVFKIAFPPFLASTRRGLYTQLLPSIRRVSYSNGLFDVFGDRNFIMLKPHSQPGQIIPSSAVSMQSIFASQCPTDWLLGGRTTYNGRWWPPPSSPAASIVSELTVSKLANFARRRS